LPPPLVKVNDPLLPVVMVCWPPDPPKVIVELPLPPPVEVLVVVMVCLPPEPVEETVELE